MSNAKVERYDAYKGSGVEWLEKMPSKWKNAKVKSTCSHIRDGTHGSFERVDGGYPLLSVRNIVNSKFVLLSDDSCVSEHDYRTISKSLKIKEGDLQLAIVGATLGKVAIVTKDMPKFVTQRSLATLRPIAKILYNRFLFYFASSSYFQDTLWSKASYSAQPGIYLYSISNVDIFLPPMLEQKAIADYLDTKTAQIDRKIDLLTQKATKYGKLKQSLINETVTRGLDKTVAMKDSGAEWIGEVPKHWEMKRGKDFVSLRKGKNPSSFTDDNQFLPYLSMDFLRGKLSNTVYILPQSNLISVDVNEILILWDGANAGEVLLSKAGYISSTMAVVKPINDISNSFLFYLLKSLEKIFMNFSSGTTIPHFDSSKLLSNSIPIPPIPEQQAIVDYLDTKTTHIDRIIETIDTHIEKLKELRKTLINDVITGKIKVT